MEYQTFTCAICGKSGLSKRQTYKFDSNGARACREHEEVKKESVPDFNKTYFGFKVDPRCPEVAYSAGSFIVCGTLKIHIVGGWW